MTKRDLTKKLLQGKDVIKVNTKYILNSFTIILGTASISPAERTFYVKNKIRLGKIIFLILYQVETSPVYKAKQTREESIIGNLLKF